MSCLYPNLAEIVRLHPYHIVTFANHADVTLDVFEAVLNEGEELTADEALNLAALLKVPLSILVAPELIMLDEGWRRSVDKLDSLSRIFAGEWTGKSMRCAVEQLVKDYGAGRASYAQYVAAKYRVEQAEDEAECRRQPAKRRSTRIKA